MRFGQCMGKSGLNKSVLRKLLNLHIATEAHSMSISTTIYDLLNQEENEIIIQLEEMLSVRLQGSQEEDGLKNIAEFYLKNGKRLNLLIGTGGYNAFLIRFKKALYPLFRTANSVADTKRSAIIYEFGINGLLMAFHAWYEHQDRMAIEDLLILLRLMIERGIPSAMMY